MKKYVSLLLAIVMCLSLVACGGKTTEDPQDTTPAQTQPTAPEVDWPTKAVTVVVPYSAGGDTDTYARAACQSLEKVLGQPFVVVNTTGGSGVVASEEVRAAEPDGYTLLWHHTGANLVHEGTDKVAFSFTDDFTNVCTMCRATTYVLVALKDSPMGKTTEEFISYAKAHPGEVRYSNVFGSNSHFQALLLQNAMGIEFELLDVGTGASERLAAFLGGQCDVLCIDYMNVKDYIETGDMIAYGVMAEDRVPGMEDIPTFKEQGYDTTASKNYEFRFPKGVDEAIVAKLSAACKQIVETDKDFEEALKPWCAYPFYRDSETMIAENRAEVNSIREFWNS